jgi:hypothetical protein
VISITIVETWLDILFAENQKVKMFFINFRRTSAPMGTRQKKFNRRIHRIARRDGGRRAGRQTNQEVRF